MADDIRRDDYRGSVLLNLLAGFESINLGSLLEHTFEGGGGGRKSHVAVVLVTHLGQVPEGDLGKPLLLTWAVGLWYAFRLSVISSSILTSASNRWVRSSGHLGCILCYHLIPRWPWNP